MKLLARFPITKISLIMMIVFLIASFVLALCHEKVRAYDAIYMGAACSNRAAYEIYTYTYLSLNSPAAFTGTITSVSLWTYGTVNNTKVGVFYDSGGGSYVCRSEVSLGTVVYGACRTYSGLRMVVYAGDLIGWYGTSGAVESATSGGSGVLRYSGDGFSGSHSYSTLSGHIMSLSGSGLAIGYTTLTMQLGNSTIGHVSPVPGVYEYFSDEVVNISTWHINGWQFEDWNGNVTDPDAESTTVSMTENRVVSPNFVEGGACPTPTPTPTSSPTPSPTPTPVGGCGLETFAGAVWPDYIDLEWCYVNVTGNVTIKGSFTDYPPSIDDGFLVYSGTDGGYQLPLDTDLSDKLYLSAYVVGFTGVCNLSIGGEGLEAINITLQAWLVMVLALGLSFVSLKQPLMWFITCFAWIAFTAVSTTVWIQGISIFLAIVSIVLFILGTEKKRR